MAKRVPRNEAGFTLIELMVAMALTLVIMAAVLTVFKKASDAAYQVSLRAEMQANARVAINEIVLDLNQAGSGKGMVGLGAIPIPKAPSAPGDPAGAINPLFGCDPGGCHLPGSGATGSNQFTDGQLYKVAPGHFAGPLVAGSPNPNPTDVMTITYIDPTIDGTANPASGWNGKVVANVAPDGSSVVAQAADVPKLADPQFGLHIGDIVLLQNQNGRAVGDVTGFDPGSGTIFFGNADPLQLNQTGAPSGSIATSLSNPAPPLGDGLIPAPSISRLIMVTYYLDDQVAGADGPDSQLMRQVGSQRAVPLAEHIENLQFFYDLFDPDTNSVTAGLPDAATGVPPSPKPNEIRKVNITITARSPRRNRQGGYDRVTFNTSVGPRNLGTHDSFQ